MKTLTPAQRIDRAVDFLARTIASTPARETEIAGILTEWDWANQELTGALSFPDLLAQLAHIADQAGFLTAEQRTEVEKRVARAIRQHARRLGKPWGAKALPGSSNDPNMGGRSEIDHPKAS
jgi:hypothetical protein